MRLEKNIKKSATLIMLVAALLLGVPALDASEGNSHRKISLHLVVGQLITDNQVGGSPTGIVFSAEVAANTEGPMPFETVSIETPAGAILALRETEESGLFAFSKLYDGKRYSEDYRKDLGQLGGEYRLVFDRNTPEETTIYIDYPYTSFYNDFPLIIFPVHEDDYAPLQMVAKWDPVLQWRDYEGIIVTLDQGWEDTERLFTSEMLSPRATSLDLEAKYAILETDTPHTLTVKLVNRETGEAAIQVGAHPVEYTVSAFGASRVFFITTPDYYIGNSSADTTCFIHTARPGRQ